ncbi:hypothetical protein F1737_05600 [Methanoplanus sp. FWC-SCC4]|uniref:Glutamate synthase alpha subunit C-terminal domain-containing protein n=1 Tax=Methanochimaera problematica TaxID=2609417 RepID=A0AA97FDG7_9EURY|nr:hypothetical protein [Methanoplanus sp. FWC-SCC4]WOF16219.1 hypothetical protein F1737_05600 [Methanoplanus sp. FWC-SCC4]
MPDTITIDAKDMHYTPLNKKIREAVNDGAKEIIIENVLGQRFIGNGLRGDDVEIKVKGVPGGDIAMFMSGPHVTVYGNCDHAPGNTMDAGVLVIHGSSGDATAHSMRGGEVYVRDDIGYRGGIHMKAYHEKRPVLVVGGQAKAFLGEYMAGGILIVLGMNQDFAVNERGIGSGIHGGMIFVRGDVDENLLGIGAKKEQADMDDLKTIRIYIEKFADYFGFDSDEILKSGFTKIVPASARPFANKYCWE